MPEPAKAVQLPDTPYPGIEPYTYADRTVFFGRESEARELIRMVVTYRGVLLYSDSGNGKSSLINAGLMQLALSEGYQPNRIRVQPRKGQEIVVERLVDRAGVSICFLPSTFFSNGNSERAALSVEAFLQGVRDAVASGKRPLLVFDQFEEWVTLFEEGSAGQTVEEVRGAHESIANAICSLLQESKLPVKVLISLREDYLAKLTPLFKQYPRLPDQYLRLAPLPGEQVCRVIRSPFERYPHRYPREIDPPLASAIQKQFLDRSPSGNVRLSEVQIVCRSLFDSGNPTQQMGEFFERQGGVQGILEKYFDDALKSLGKEQREPAICLLSRMVTSAGTRNVIWEGDLLSRVENEDGIPHDLLKDTLDKLANDRTLVLRSSRRDVYYYEIASEFLVGWIGRKAKERELLVEKRKEEEKQRAEEAQRKLAEMQSRAARRRRLQAVTLSSAVLVAAVLAIFAWKLERKRTREAMEANSLRLAGLVHPLQADPDTGFHLALQAAWETYTLDKSIMPETENALRDMLGKKQSQCTLQGVVDGISDIAFSPDGMRVATAESDKARIWNVLSGKPLTTLSEHSEAVGRVVFDPQGKYLATTGAHQPVRVWDSSAGQLVATIPVNKEVWDIVFGQDGNRLAAVLSDTHKKVWEIPSAQEVHLADGQVDQLFGFTLKNDWDMKNPSKAEKMLQDRTGWIVYRDSKLDPAISFRAFSPDGKYLATAKNDGSVVVRDASTGKSLFKHSSTQGGVRRIVFSPDGGALAVAGSDGTVEVIGTGSPFHNLSGRTDAVTAVAFSQDGNRLAAGSEDKTVTVYSVQRPFKSRGSTSRLIVSPDGSRVAGIELDGAVKVWENPSGDLVAGLPNSDTPTRLAFSLDGKRLAVAVREGYTWLWEVGSFRPTKVPTGNISIFSFRKDGNQLAALVRQEDAIVVKVWDLDSGQANSAGSSVKLLDVPQRFFYQPAAFSPKGDILATVAREQHGEIKLWDAFSGRSLHKLQTDTNTIRDLFFSPDGKRLAASKLDDNGTIEIWDVSAEQRLRSVPLGRARIQSSQVAFGKDGSHLIVISDEGVVETLPLALKDLMESAFARERDTFPLKFSDCQKYRLTPFTQCRIAGLLEEGVKLAKSGNGSGSEAKFREAKNLDSTYPVAEVRRLAAESLAADGRKVALDGDLSGALEDFRKAKLLYADAKLDPESVARHWMAVGKLRQGKSLLDQVEDRTSDKATRSALWPDASAAYSQVLDADKTLKLSARDWNGLCWYGSLLGRARDALTACDHAVDLDPDPNFRDSRGLARALTGQFPGAIEDFLVFINDPHADKTPKAAQERQKRRGYVDSLRNGKNPFTQIELDRLLGE
jgi:WD40 repeat protein